MLSICQCHNWKHPDKYCICGLYLMESLKVSMSSSKCRLRLSDAQLDTCSSIQVNTFVDVKRSYLGIIVEHWWRLLTLIRGSILAPRFTSLDKVFCQDFPSRPRCIQRALGNTGVKIDCKKSSINIPIWLLYENITKLFIITIPQLYWATLHYIYDSFNHSTYKHLKQKYWC